MRDEFFQKVPLMRDKLYGTNTEVPINLPFAKMLVYCECYSSSYHLIQAFLGPIRAGFYQAFATLFGASLNKKYDPNGVDRLTERVVRQVESGQI